MQIVNGGNPYNSDHISDEYICINSCGYHIIESGELPTTRLSGRSDFQIIYMWKGKGIFNFNGKIEMIKEGQLVVYKPFEPQIYTYKGKDKPEAYWIHFTGRGIEELLQKCGLWENKVYYIGKCGEINELILKIIKEIQLKPYQFELFCNGYFIYLISNISRRIEQQKSSIINKKYEKLVYILESMHNDYKIDKSIEEYAQLCNLSKYRFMHLFKKYTGISAHLYKTQIRIEKAKDLLRNTPLSISEISEIVGYSDSLYFSRVFKKSTGQSPNIYKKNL